MPPKTVDVPVEQCDSLPEFQPRRYFDPEAEQAFRENIAKHGQLVPGIGWLRGVRYAVADGGRRLTALIAASKPTFRMLLLDEEPSRFDLQIAQASIDVHRQDLPSVDRARLFQGIVTEGKLNGKQLAEALGISPSLVSYYLAVLDLAPDLQDLVNASKLDLSKGVMIAREAKDHEKQREMAKAAMTMSRAELAGSVRKAKNGNGQSAQFKRLRLPLPSGIVVTIGAEDEVDLESTIDALTQLVRAMKCAREDGISSKNLARVLADKAQA